MNLQCPTIGCSSPQKRSAGSAGASPQVTVALVAAVDVDVADVAAIIDVAPPRQIRRSGRAVAERAVSADAVRTVAVIGIASAARDAPDAHAVTGRGRRGDAGH